MAAAKASRKRALVLTLIFASLVGCGDSSDGDTAPSGDSAVAAPSSSPPPDSPLVPSLSSDTLTLVVETSIEDVGIVRNGELSADLPVRYEVFAAARLAELRSRENLDAVIAGATDEFELMLRLKDWVAAQWSHGLPDPYPPWDAVAVLDWIRSGITNGFCAQYSQVLLQSLAALGYRARYVEVGTVDNPYAHFVVEVWSNQFDKWILLDADYNVHFERAGVPLSALEVHEALTREEVSDVVTVLGSVRQGHPDPNSWPLSTAELYYYVRVHLKADHLTMPNEPPFDRYNDMIEWRSEIAVPWESSTVPSPYPKVALTNLTTSDRSLVQSKLDQVVLTIESVDDDSVELSFENNGYDFLRYQIRERGPQSVGEWRDCDGSSFDWRPAPPFLMTFEVRTMNTHGVGGPPSAVTARLDFDIAWVTGPAP